MRDKLLDKNEDIVGPQAIADWLGVSRNTILNWSRSEKIPCIKIGRIYRYSLKKISESIGHAPIIHN